MPNKSNVLKISDFLHVEWLPQCIFVSSQSGSPNADTPSPEAEASRKPKWSRHGGQQNESGIPRPPFQPSRWGPCKPPIRSAQFHLDKLLKELGTRVNPGQQSFRNGKNFQMGT